MLALAITLDCLFKSEIGKLQYAPATDVVCTIVSIALTVISITLSIPNEKIYGVDRYEFRKLRGKSGYSFLFILFVSIVCLISVLVCDAFGLIISLWFSTVISIFYCFIFCHQEIPTLTHDNNTILKLVAKALKKDKKNINARTAVQHYLLSKNGGIRNSVCFLDGANFHSDKSSLAFVLELQNDFLFDFTRDDKSLVQQQSKDYNGFDVMESFNVAFENLCEISSLDSPVCATRLLEKSDNNYLITRSIFNLHQVSEVLKMETNYKEKMHRLLHMPLAEIMFNTGCSAFKDFTYKTIISMIVSTVSDGELWFLKSLVDDSSSSLFDCDLPDDLLIFISIFLYYISCLEPNTSADARTKINNFLERRISLFGIRQDKFSDVVKKRLDSTDFNNVVPLLNDLLSIYSFHRDESDWFFNSFWGVGDFSSLPDKSFSKRLIINCWIGFVLTNEMLEISSFPADFSLSLDKLSQENKELVAEEINTKWFTLEDKASPNIDLSYLTYYGFDASVGPYFAESDIAKKMITFTRETLKKRCEIDIVNNLKSESELQAYRKEMEEGLSKAISRLPFKDDTLSLDDAEEKAFRFLVDVNGSKAMIGSFIKNFSESLNRTIYKEFTQTVKPKKLSSFDFTKEQLSEVATSDFDFRSSNIYQNGTDSEENTMIERIREIRQIDSGVLPRHVFFKKQAIKTNAVYISGESCVRRLTKEEVANIIDANYKKVNGLYEYEKGPNGSQTALYSKDEMMGLIFLEYFYVCLVFKFKASFDEKNILYFENSKGQ